MREKLIELLEQSLSYDGTGREMRFTGSDVTPCLIANGVTVQEWISVKDRLPDKTGQYLCRYVFGDNPEYPFFQVLYYYTVVENPHFQNEGCFEMRVTHWMPLPQPPKGE